MWYHRFVHMFVAFLCALLLVHLPGVARGASVQSLGLTLQALSSEDLDAIQRATGHRVGVQVVQVAPGSAAAQAGLKDGDVLFAVAGTAVASPEAVEQALTAKTGTIAVMGIRPTGPDSCDTLQLTLVIPPAGTTATTSSPPGEIQAKLKALAAAHDAGVLSDAEYAKKKAELEAQLAPAPAQLDAATQKKLTALDNARAAGILSDEEYAVKKAELLGARAVGADAPPNYRDPQGRFQFSYPRDWSVQAIPGDRGVILSRGADSISIFLTPDAASAQTVAKSTLDQVRAQWKDFNELHRGDSKIDGRQSFTVEYTGINPKGVRAHAQLATLVANDTGYTLLLSVAEAAYSSALPAWKAVCTSFDLSGNAAADGNAPVAVANRHAGSTYQHPVGFSFWYPTGWTIKAQDAGLLLTPPNQASNAQGPSEVYLITGDNANGVASADDPRVLQYLDMQVQRLSPAFKRTGEVGVISGAFGKGISATWEAPGNQGQTVQARAYATILRGFGIALFALGAKEQIAKRDANLREMFSSFGMGEGQRDNAVTGRWGYAATFSITNNSMYETASSRASSVSDNSKMLELHADGTWLRTSESHMLAGGSGVWVESNNRDVTKGNWNAGDGHLYLIDDKGGWEEYRYQMRQGPNGRVLVLISGEKGENWVEQR